MRKLVTAENMKALDEMVIKNFRIKASVLMENAGKAVFDSIVRNEGNISGKKFTVVCGKGNNGGDGLVTARYLIEAGADVSVFVTGPKTSVSKESKKALLKLEKIYKKVISVKSAKDMVIEKGSILIDAIFGTGFSSNPEGLFFDIIAMMNDSGSKIYSVDIPSCIHGTTGFSGDIAVKADITVTFAYPKIGLFINDGYEHSGRVETADIGFPAEIDDEILDARILTDLSDATGIIKKRELMSDKKDYGKLFNLAGSISMPGAAVMSSLAALRSGTGLIKLGIPMNISASISSVNPEIMCLPLAYAQPGFSSPVAEKELAKGHRWCDACLVGPGLSVHPETKKLFKKFLHKLGPKPVVLDADALNILAENPDTLKKLSPNFILTPHDSEMSRLCQTTKELFSLNRLELCAQKAVEWNCYIILKGTPTIIAHPDGKILLHVNKNPAMAVGGMGDALSGMTAGFAARKIPADKAILAAVYIHSEAARIATEKYGDESLLPSDVIKEIHNAIKNLRKLEIGLAEK